MRHLRKFLTVLFLLAGMFIANAASGYAIVGSKKIPIEGYFTIQYNGKITGKYAYKSTLKKYGRNNRASWLYISGNDNDRYLTVRDSNGKVVEYWYNFNWYDDGYYNAEVHNKAGKVFYVDFMGK